MEFDLFISFCILLIRFVVICSTSKQVKELELNSCRLPKPIEEFTFVMPSYISSGWADAGCPTGPGVSGVATVEFTWTCGKATSEKKV